MNSTASMQRWLYICRRSLSLLGTLRIANSGSILSHYPHELSLKRSHSPTLRPISVTHCFSSRRNYSSSAGSCSWPIPKAVIFDLGGVVVPSPQPIFDRFEEKHGLTKGSLVKTIKVKGDRGAFGKLERGEISIENFPEPFRNDYKEITSVELTLEQMQEFIKSLSDFTKLSPDSAIIECIQWLKNKGVKVAILTNNFRWDNGDTVFPKESIKGVDVVHCVM